MVRAAGRLRGRGVAGMTRAPHLYESSPAVSRFNAWFFDAFDGIIDWSLRRLKKRVYQDTPDTIVEIGPGVGANFRYYRPGTTVVAIEPNMAMHDRLRRNAREADIDLVLKDALAEATGLPDESAEMVVSNLVLCTVTDPEAAVAEAHRILGPGGRLVVVEHVHGRGPALRLLQRIVSRPWRWLFEGCELNRDTAATIRDAGFDRVELRERTLITPFVPINSFAYGSATK